MMDNKTKKHQLPSGVTKEQISAWKEEYGANRIHLAKLPTEKGEKVKVIFRTPDRRITNIWLKFADKDPAKADSILINNLVLFGRELIDADDITYRAIIKEIYSKVPDGEGETVNL